MVTLLNVMSVNGSQAIYDAHQHKRTVKLHAEIITAADAVYLVFLAGDELYTIVN